MTVKPTILYDDFAKLDLRIGQVIEASAPEWSRKLLEFKVDFGPEIGQKTIFSAIRQWYEPSFFINKNFVFVANLAERKMGEGVSQGMMIMADDQGTPIPFSVNGETAGTALAPGLVVC